MEISLTTVILQEHFWIASLALAMTNDKVLFYQRHPGVYFTKRETQCMECFIVGFKNKQTANTLHLSARTIESYLKNMKEKLS